MNDTSEASPVVPLTLDERLDLGYAAMVHEYVLPREAVQTSTFDAPLTEDEIESALFMLDVVPFAAEI